MAQYGQRVAIKRTRKPYLLRKPKNQTDLESSDVTQSPVDLKSNQPLSQAQILHLQGTIGNKAVQRMMIQRAGGSDKVQEGFGTTEQVLSPISGVGKGVGEGLGTGWTKWSGSGIENPGQTKQLNTMETVGTGVGVGFDSVNFLGQVAKTTSNSMKTNKAVKEKERLKTEGDTGGSRWEFQNRRHREGGVGVTEGVTSGLTSGFGIVVGSLSLASKLTNMAAAVLQGIGAGLGVLTGLVGMIRDSANIHKRGKAKGKISGLMSSYESIEANLNTKLDKKKIDQQQKLLEVQKLKDDVDVLNKSPKNNEALIEQLTKDAQKKKDEADVLQTEVNDLEADVQTYSAKAEDMLTALGVSKRKQGAGGKIFSLISNIASMGVGVVGIVAAATGAAALGPVGWIAGGILLVTGLSFMIGMKIKQAMRSSNVLRMREERDKIKAYFTTGPAALGLTGTDDTAKQTEMKGKLKKQHTKKTGVDSKLAEYLNAAPNQRGNVRWYRELFPTAEEKGWFNRFLSLSFKKKGHSGVTTLNERMTILNEYLDKYDKESAGDTAWAGIVSALTDPKEGALEVNDPKDTTGATKTTLKAQITELIMSFYPKRGTEIINEIVTLGTKPTLDPTEQEKLDAAKKLVLEKMKLADK